jgi:putative tryptophan/tyrosine transport system ATP-binding protein
MELEISEIRKTFGSSEGEPAFTLDLPRMTFKSGTIVFVMGHNGSGKSVTLKLMAGEILPSNGFVNFRFGEKSWRSHESPSGIVRQQANDSLAMDLSVRENLLLRGLPHSLMDSLFPIVRLKDQVNALVSSHAELQRKLDQACRNLSGGQKQALAFLTVTSRNYPVLFLDEFLAATDSNTSHLLRRLTREYAQGVPACVFIASHDVPLALADADRILVFKEGRLIRDMPRNDLDWNERSLMTLLMEHTEA